MKTTLIIDDQLMERLRQEAARRKQSLSALVAEALHSWLRKPRSKPTPTKLPSFKGGGFLVDIANRDQLHDAMDGR